MSANHQTETHEKSISTAPLTLTASHPLSTVSQTVTNALMEQIFPLDSDCETPSSRQSGNRRETDPLFVSESPIIDVEKELSPRSARGRIQIQAADSDPPARLEERRESVSPVRCPPEVSPSLRKRFQASINLPEIG